MFLGPLLAATPTPSPTAGTADEAAGATTNWPLALVAFALLALLLIVLLYYFAGVGKQPRPLAFTRFYSLMFVSVVAVLLAFGDVAIEAKTAAFTLLGTIAGYLAGAKQISETRETTNSADGAADGDGDEPRPPDGEDDAVNAAGGTPARTRAATRVVREKNVL